MTAATEVNAYSAAFDDDGHWEIALSPDCDPHDIVALAPLVSAIEGFARS